MFQAHQISPGKTFRIHYRLGHRPNLPLGSSRLTAIVGRRRLATRGHEAAHLTRLQLLALGASTPPARGIVTFFFSPRLVWPSIVRFGRASKLLERSVSGRADAEATSVRAGQCGAAGDITRSSGDCIRRTSILCLLAGATGV